MVAEHAESEVALFEAIADFLNVGILRRKRNGLEKVLDDPAHLVSSFRRTQNLRDPQNGHQHMAFHSVAWLLDLDHKGYFFKLLYFC